VNCSHEYCVKFVPHPPRSETLRQFVSEAYNMDAVAVRILLLRQGKVFSIIHECSCDIIYHKLLFFKERP